MKILKKIISSSRLKIFMLLFASITMLSACGDREPSCPDQETDSQALINAKAAIGEKSRYQEWIEFNQNGGTCPEFLSKEQQDCWQSNILGLLYDAMGKITMNAYQDLTKGALNVMMVVFCIWFGFQLMKNLGSLKEGDSPGDFWTSVLKKFFFCFICGTLASSTDGLLYVLNAIIFPIFNAFLELASYLLAFVTQISDNIGSEIPMFDETYKTAVHICSASPDLLYAPANADGFPQGPNAMMQCLICNVAEKLSIGVSLSYKLMSLGILFPKVIALILLMAFAFVKLGFVFYLVETIFKFTMMVVMLPIFLLGLPFEQTRGWMTEAMKIILSGAAYVLAISVVMSLAIVAIIQLIATNNLFAADLFEFTIFSPVIMVLLMIAFLVKKTMGVAAQIATTFTGSEIKSKFQEALGGMLKMAAQGIASIITIGSLAPIFQKYNITRKIYERGVEIKEKLDKFQKKIDELRGGAEEDDEDEGEEEEEKKND